MAGSATAAPLQAPGLARRLACFVYEGTLLFGVLMIAGLVYGMLTQQRHALIGMQGLRLFLFVVLGAYFCWFWSHGGQTVAMKTWHIRLLTRHGAPIKPLRALSRYLLSWLWFMPALVTAYAAGLRSAAAVTLALTAGAVLYALLALLNRERQYLHDLLCGTRLVLWSPAPAAPHPAAPNRATRGNG